VTCQTGMTEMVPSILGCPTLWLLPPIQLGIGHMSVRCKLT